MLTAISWEVLTIILPELVPIEEDPLNLNVSYENTSISTLSFREPNTDYDIVRGLLYVPDLNASDPCQQLSSQHLPQNVTRKADIPHQERYAIIGIAPWISDRPDCATSYIRASRADPTSGLFFFPTRPDASIDTPVWDNEDWGANRAMWGDWVRGTDFSIWGIPSASGAILVQEMAKYSGNITAAPFSSEMTQTFPPEDVVRLFARVTHDSNGDSNPILGRLWVFAIMILSILCFVTALTSFLMHLNQRRLRRGLRRRIAAGEVDLEILGIKRRRVPQKLLDNMPLYVYTSKLGPGSATSPKDKREEPAPTSFQLMTPAQRKMLPNRAVPLSQPTCPICLDDFEHNETIVRELPCQHIFHPECIDDFLRLNSSLCPVCKSSALPVGYCPEKITIAMVRRERSIRRRHEDGPEPQPLSAMLPASLHRFLPTWLLRIRPRSRQPPHRRPDSASQQPGPDLTQTTTPPHHDTANLELAILPPPPPSTLQLSDPPPAIQALSPEARREWGRRRLAATLPAAPGPGEEDPPVRRAFAWRRLFPSA